MQLRNTANAMILYQVTLLSAVFKRLLNLEIALKYMGWGIEGKLFFLPIAQEAPAIFVGLKLVTGWIGLIMLISLGYISCLNHLLVSGSRSILTL